jgi:hypothetical protein
MQNYLNFGFLICKGALPLFFCNCGAQTHALYLLGKYYHLTTSPDLIIS